MDSGTATFRFCKGEKRKLNTAEQTLRNYCSHTFTLSPYSKLLYAARKAHGTQALWPTGMPGTPTPDLSMCSWDQLQYTDFCLWDRQPWVGREWCHDTTYSKGLHVWICVASLHFPDLLMSTFTREGKIESTNNAVCFEVHVVIG